ncbi:MAG: choice-of-anchor D domain-containing protein, partial [Candidatus Acidiferrales bacterium]
MRRLVFVLPLILAALLPAPSLAQNTINTIAGGELPNNVAATAAGLEGVFGVVRDANANLYVLTDVGVIYKVTPSGAMTIYAGNITAGYSGDGGPATAALLAEPFAGALDASGNLYFSDSANCVIRKITASTGIITTVVGNGACNYTGDGGPATSAALYGPQGIAFDPAGNLFIADTDNTVIRKVTASTGIISTFAGNGNSGYSGDGGAATQATLSYPLAVATDANGNLYIADSQNNAIRLVNSGTNIITTVAGNGAAGYSGDGGPAAGALLNYPAGVALDTAGNLYISDTSNAVIRKVVDGTINTIIGNGNYAFSGDGGPALSASLTNPFALAVDAAGDVWIADLWANRIRMYSATTLNINTVVGNGSVYDGNAPTAASLYFPRNPALDAQGNLYITDEGNNRIRFVSAATGLISTVAGTGIPCPYPTATCGDGGPAVNAAFYNPKSVGIDPTESYILIADTLDNRLREVDVATGIVTTIAGTGNLGFSGDGGPATQAELNSPRGFAYDSAGNLYFPDSSNHRIRMINKATGIITTVAGSGGVATQSQGCQNGGYSGDGGPATSAQLDCPLGVAIDSNNNLYIADILNNVVRKVDAKTQIITTIVGNGTQGYTGDNGPASMATLNQPDRISVNSAGNIFISDTGNGVIRRVDAATQIITTFAGSGTFGFSGDGGPALSAAMAEPTGVVVTDQGNLYVADLYNNRVRIVTLTPGITIGSTTVAFGNQAINSTSAAQNVTVTNSGDAPLNFNNAFASGDFSVSNSTCGDTLAVGAQCVLSITFSPTSFGPLTGTLTFNDNAPVPGSTQMIPLSGTGAASLTVTLAGAGSGTVTSTPAGINCGAACTADFTADSSVTLAAAPATGSTFAGWSGACTGTGSCVVAMTQNQSVTATFNASVGTVPLTVAFAGTGGGTVTGSGINCTNGSGAACSVNLAAGAQVTLMAAPATGSTFASWSAPCAGSASATCSFAMPATALTVTATFNTSAASFLLTVATAGTGTGTVTGAGITCTTGSTAGCSTNVTAGTQVSLTAAAASGSTFTSWSAICTSTTSSACSFVMPATAQAVTATFALNQATLQSIAVTPANPTVPIDSTQQFTATGTYSDDSTKNITSSVSWASSNNYAATINESGLAYTGEESGVNSTISATLGEISGSTLLTVNNSPITITVTPPPG